jgi:predicted nucleotidyltransferase
MHKIRSDKPLNPIVHAVLRTLRAMMEKHGINYFVTGATARDIMMAHVFGIDAARATRDVDFAVALDSWRQFEIIKDDFIGTGDFQPSPGEVHRLFYKYPEFGAAYPLDLLPFGKIEREGQQIAWPPDMSVLMSVAGYGEALASAIEVDVGDALIVKVASIPALTALKVLAWNDRGLSDNRDAQDLHFLLRHYHEAGNGNRMYEQALALMEANDFNLELAGATLLGHDTRMIANTPELQALLAILADPAKRDRLAIHMDRPNAALSTTAASLIDKFETGLQLTSI